MGVLRLGIGFVVVFAALGCNRLEKKNEAAASAALAAAPPPSNDVFVKINDKPVEKVNVVTALSSGVNIDLVLDCQVDCSIYEQAYTPGVARKDAIEDKCGPKYRYITIAMNPSGPLKAGTYDQNKFSLGIRGAEDNANLLFDAKSAKLELKSETEGSFEAGTKGSFKAKLCKS